MSNLLALCDDFLQIWSFHIVVFFSLNMQVSDILVTIAITLIIAQGPYC